MLDPSGPQAARIADLYWLFAAITGFVYLAVVVALLLALRRRAAQAEPRDQGRRAWVVKTATGVTVVLLFVLLIASVRTGRALSELREPELTIEVVGHQWWWQVTYPDPQPALRVTTANEIHVPAGKRVALRMRSDDVIHSFWVPSLHGKRDLIPGYETWLVVQSDRPGVHRGRCAEFCGYQHAHMELVVVAHPELEFQRWLARQRQPAHEPTTDEQRRGEQLFTTGSCALCHAVNGTLAASGHGPDLTHLMSRSWIAAARLPNTRDNLRAWVRDPQRIKPGSNMPPNPLPGADLDALVAYLETLR